MNKNIILRNINELINNSYKSNYHTFSLVTIFEKTIMECLKEEKISKYSNKTLNEVLLAVENDSLNELIGMDYILANIFKNYPYLKDIKNEKFDYFKVSNLLYKELKKDCESDNKVDLKNDISLYNDSTLNFAKVFKSICIEEKNTKIENIYYLVIDLIMNDDSSKDKILKSFNEIKGVESEEWFYKYPRVLDISDSGYVDMAYHAVLQSSIIIKYMVDQKMKLNEK